jgi:lipid-A-disaccharide synthase
LHGSNLIHELKLLDSAAQIRCWGGDKMQDAGAILVKHYSELAFMGFIEVLKNLRTIFKNLANCKADITQYQPDVLVLIDYPGFNLRIASWAKQKGLRVIYYISPQVWAWKESRVNGIKKNVDKMLVILPFEKEFYENKHHYPVHFVGHPLIDAIHNQPQVDEAVFRKENHLNGQPIIAILPGSRKQEITKMLSVMLSVVKDFPDYQFVIAGAPSQEFSFYSGFITSENIKFVSNKTYDLLSNATAALVTSGTATLETALFKVPEVVCYKGSWASYQIAKRIITLKYISLVNLIMDQEVVTELIQDHCSKKKIRKELKKILEPHYRETLLKDYNALEAKLGGIGASAKTAKLIVGDLRKSS